MILSTPQIKIIPTKNYTFDSFLNENQLFIHQFHDNRLMQLIKSKEMQNKAKRNKLLDCIQVFSNYFQKMVMLRYCFSDNKKFLPVSLEHLNEEFGHNNDLDNDRNFREQIWDPILEATASWFSWKMFTLNDEEKTVMVHLVLEASANIFFQQAHKVMSYYDETEYFKIHSEADEEHEKMGRELLKHQTPEQYRRLFEVQSQGWDMLNTVCNRIAEIVEYSYI